MDDLDRLDVLAHVEPESMLVDSSQGEGSDHVVDFDDLEALAAEDDGGPSLDADVAELDRLRVLGLRKQPPAARPTPARRSADTMKVASCQTHALDG